MIPGSSSIYFLISVTISRAALPTDFMVIAENAYGSIAPIRSPEKIKASVTVITSAHKGYSKLRSPYLVIKAPNKAIATKAALPIAKPLPIAAVVLPAASRASVLCLVASPKLDISAIPPALSEIGP